MSSAGFHVANGVNTDNEDYYTSLQNFYPIIFFDIQFL